MTAERKNDERETHICMSRSSDKMQIFTTEYHIMKRLDRYVEESENWRVIEVGKINGKVVSKIYEAPRDLLIIRKKKRELTEEQRLAAAERLKRYHRQKKNPDDTDEVSDKECDDDTSLYDFEENDDGESQNTKMNSTGKPDAGQNNGTSSTGETPRMYPEKENPEQINDNVDVYLSEQDLSGFDEIEK